MWPELANTCPGHNRLNANTVAQVGDAASTRPAFLRDRSLSVAWLYILIFIHHRLLIIPDERNIKPGFSNDILIFCF